MRILVAMSGGVDSAVAALLLQAQGAEVVGAYMKNWINEEDVAGDCPWMQDITDGRAVAERLGLEFRVVNLMRDYRAKVVDYLLEEYRRGSTPNPDVLCNREIKFGAFLAYARREGFDAIATGHYARRRELSPGRFGLFEGADPNKDQSYFLALLTQEQLAQARFPLGELTKSRVRERAREAGLPNAAKKDSQGICFIGDIRMQDFLGHHLPDQPGEIVRATDGVVLGRHRGLHFFTIGQRRGIGIPSNTDHHNYVVVARDIAANRLLVAFEDIDAPGLWSQEATLVEVGFNSGRLEHPTRVQVRVRYRDPLVDAWLEPQANHRARVIFEQPQRALATGQVIAIHRGQQLLGGGFFATTTPCFPLPIKPMG